MKTLCLKRNIISASYKKMLPNLNMPRSTSEELNITYDQTVQKIMANIFKEPEQQTQENSEDSSIALEDSNDLLVPLPGTIFVLCSY